MAKHDFVYYVLLTGALFHWLLPRINGVRVNGDYPTALGLGMIFRLVNIPLQEFALSRILAFGLRAQTATAFTVTAFAAIASSLLISAAVLRVLAKTFPLLLEVDTWKASLLCAIALTILRLLFPH
ncbi:MAG: hypothetical protein K2X77_14445 [Candidatus Obscuribacterales bacterium]|jgi:hypothetical protein|nr:hypothetical protein [Candidatus Obscuribacterales bacterium]